MKRRVCEMLSKDAAEIVIRFHYLHRKPPISYAFQLIVYPTFAGEGAVLGVITFGVPASRHLQKSVCPSNPDLVLELNRLWVHDIMPRNTESWFIAKALKLLPPRLVCSYADTAAGHTGYVYRASNWYYYGWTDMDRKTPRFDYVVPGKHSRDAFRSEKREFIRVRRKPKYRYWLATGTRRDKRRLVKICGWKQLSWSN